MRSKFLFIALFFLCISFIFPHEEVKNLKISSEGIELLEIECGAGFLEVVGHDALGNIEVKAEIILDGQSPEKAKDFIRKRVELTLEKRGNRAVLISKIDSSGSIFSWGNKVINLTVNLPKNMDLDVDDGSGSIIIENIRGNIDMEDGSGTLEIKDVTGDMNIEDGSGIIDIENIDGNIDIDDNSGEIRAEKISGEISIDDGSGSINIKDVEGPVTVSDGSGSINIDGVEKDVIIKDDGSGGVKIRNVKGKVIQ